MTILVTGATGTVGRNVVDQLIKRGADVRALFLRHGVALTLAGLVLGIGAALLLTPIMSALLYGVAPTDPVTYAASGEARNATTSPTSSGVPNRPAGTCMSAPACASSGTERNRAVSM